MTTDISTVLYLSTAHMEKCCLCYCTSTAVRNPLPDPQYCCEQNHPNQSVELHLPINCNQCAYLIIIQFVRKREEEAACCTRRYYSNTLCHARTKHFYHLQKAAHTKPWTKENTGKSQHKHLNLAPNIAGYHIQTKLLG